jgi:sugar phosphate isomerase/epimerase
MKVSCLPVSLFGEITEGKISVKQWAQTARESGLDGFDISTLFINNHTPVYLEQIKSDIESENLPLVMMTTYPDFTHPDPLQREREVDYLNCDIAVASYLGVKYIRVLAGQAHPETPVDKGIEWAVENLRKAACTAKKYGVTLVYENHAKPGSWDYVDFSYAPLIFMEILEGIKDTGIGINFDTANTLAYGEDPIPFLNRIVDRVVTVHAADTGVRGELKHVLLGTGVVPFRDIFSVLKQRGFDGWICIEEGSNTGMSAFKKAGDFVRKTWESI